jgi:hypothetical protein
MNWWLKLYTIPGLKKLALPVVLVFLLHVAMVLFAPKFMFLAFYANGFIWWAHHKSRPMSFAANIEFHKMHIPFTQLRPALYKDMSIKALVLASVFLTHILIALSFGKGMEQLPYEVMAPMFIMSAFSEFFVFANASSLTKLPRYRLMGADVSFFKRILTKGFFAGVGFLMFFFCMVNQINPFYLMALGLVSCLMGYSLFWYRSVFHQEIAQGRPKTFFKYNGLGLASMSLLYILMAVGSASLINSSWVPSTIRLVSLQMSGEFGPKLDPQTARELLAVSHSDIPFAESLILSQTEGAGDLPLTFFYPSPSPDNLLSFIRYTKPSRENRELALRALRTGKLGKYHSEALTWYLTAKWPGNEKVPEELVAAKLKAKNLPENTRIPASK